MNLVLVNFSLGPHRCALSVSDVTEVLRIVAVTPLPQAPAFVEGVINLRGHLTPVIDMRKRLGLVPGPYSFANRIIIIKIRGHAVGLIVDQVSGVREIEPVGESIDPSESLGLDLHHNVSRVVREGDDIVMVLDPATIFTEEEHGAFNEAAAKARR
ncbi:MAG TPA: hypothetical protein DCS63_02175 [Elusimicrobia bacterium]|nr:hypothetical protein [Elusimicrobiota bacterium]